MTTTRAPLPDERVFIITTCTGSAWEDRTFPTRAAAIEEAGKIGYGGPKYIAEVVAVVE